MSSPAEPLARYEERSFVEAVRGALTHAMRADLSVIVLGEDVAGGAGQGPPLEGAMGGTFGATKGLLEEFGARRVRDTPISEAGFVGAAVGAAMAGLRPVVDLMWASFAPYCFDQIVNQAAKMRYMSGGQARIPLVLRMACGAGLRAAAQHSDTFYSLFAQIPELEVAVPATPAEAQGLLLAAIADDNPVVFLEHMALYRDRGPVPAMMEPMPLGRLGVTRAGEDVTVACVGHSLAAGLEAAERLAVADVRTEVLSLRSLNPLDIEGILGSVRRTGRLVIVEESPPRCSVASYISALVTEAAFDVLRHPPLRVTAADSPVPFSPPLEDAYLPDASAVVAAARATLGD